MGPAIVVVVVVAVGCYSGGGGHNRSQRAQIANAFQATSFSPAFVWAAFVHVGVAGVVGGGRGYRASIMVLRW